jgi:glycosyltransferase involved in cell wall biosynthesis
MADGDLVVRLDMPFPTALPAGRGTAVLCLGACFHRHERLRGLEVLVDGRPHRPASWRMPRPDLFEALPPELSNSYRGGFWGSVPIEPREHPGTVKIDVAALLESGARVVAPLGRIDVIEAPGTPGRAAPARATPDGLIAVCMATFDSDLKLFRIQVESLRAQTDTNWVCLISDDCSMPERFDEIARVVGDDVRFVLSRSERRLGYYRNFERALGMLPPEAELVALCDHDDRWYPEKLETLRDALGGAQLVYSDQRLVDRDGVVMRDTFWKGRRNNHRNLASLLVANTITGAATLFRRELAERALPFPEAPGWQFHDHWLGLVALASGDVGYVDRPLYDYVQHGAAVVGQGGAAPPEGRSTRGWRAAYFYGYLPRALLAEALLARCSGRLTRRKRRALRRFTSADRSMLGLAWLASRPLRRLFGRNETLGTETEFARGILWRQLIRLRTARRERPDGSPYDASCPPLHAGTLGHERLARWRAGV